MNLNVALSRLILALLFSDFSMHVFHILLGRICKLRRKLTAAYLIDQRSLTTFSSDSLDLHFHVSLNQERFIVSCVSHGTSYTSRLPSSRFTIIQCVTFTVHGGEGRLATIYVCLSFRKGHSLKSWWWNYMKKVFISRGEVRATTKYSLPLHL